MELERKPLLKNVKVQHQYEESTNVYIANDYDPFLHRKPEHPTSNVDTFVHLLKGNIGTGILAMPQAYKNAGLYVGLFGTMIIGFICTHCMHMLVECSKELCCRQKVPSMDYSDVCYYVFKTGPRQLRKYARLARVATDFFLCLTQLGGCCVYMLFVAENLSEIMSHYYDRIDVRIFIVLLSVPMILLNFLKNLKYLAPVSLVASALFMTGIAITFAYLLRDLPNVNTVRPFASWRTLPLYCGTAIYAFEGIGVILPLENNMKTPQDFNGFTGVLNTGMVIVSSLYTAVGFFGYLKYGDSVQASITLNLESTSILVQSAQLMIAIAVFFTYALVFYVPMKVIRPFFLRYFSNTHPCITDGVLRTTLIVFTCLVAIAVPSLGPIIALVGALGSSTLALILPPLFSILTFGLDAMGRYYWKLWKNLFITYFGMLSFVFGTYQSLRQLFELYY